MPRKFDDFVDMEILYCVASSADPRGKRVLVRLAGVENLLFLGDILAEGEAGLLGLTKQAQQEIQQFFEVE